MNQAVHDPEGDARDRVLVRVEQGLLGGRPARGVVRFDAVPYAAAPLGELRWQAPRPPLPWHGAREADRCAAPAAQGDGETTEDCLHLAVCTPACDAARRPVLVWLQGDAAAGPDGERLAREGDVVVVVVRYRVGVLGYLPLDELPAANVALLDIEAALQWLQRHADRFGGDAACITVAGQSADALAIALLLARRPRGGAPFARAILQSAPLGTALPDRAAAGEIGRRFLHHLGDALPPGGERLAHLQRLPLARLLQAQGETAAWVAQTLAPPGEPMTAFGPWADGRVLPEAAAFERALDAAAGSVDVLIGANRDELGACGSPERLQADWQRAGLSEAVLDAYRGADQAARFRSYLGDRLFRRPVVRWVEQAAAAGRRAFAYSFDWAPAHSPFGAAHGIELPFVFGPSLPSDGALFTGASQREVERLSSLLRRAWLGFVRQGRPDGPGLPPWPSVTPSQRPVLHFDRVCSVNTVVVR